MKFEVIIIFFTMIILGCSCDKDSRNFKWPFASTHDYNSSRNLKMKSYTVNFNSNGGTDLHNQTVKEDGLIKEPTLPIKQYSSFQGWYLDEKFTINWDFSTDIVIADTTLYAKWIEETFNVNDKPDFVLDINENFKLRLPWNYDKDYNQDREYPLIVSLHGSTTHKDHYMIPTTCNTEEIMQTHPFFFLAPNANTRTETRSWEEATDWLLTQIELIKTKYRIDINRIYLIGFSMGGSGSYIIANTYYKDYNQLFAGIIRVAGMSQSIVADTIAENTSIWYHVGLKDSNDVQSVAKKAYRFIDTHPVNTYAEHDLIKDEFLGYKRKTKIIRRHDIEVYKYSEYTGMEHDPIPVYDILTINWLFKQFLN